MSLATLTIVAIGLYLLITAGVAYAAQQQGEETLEDYFVGGRNTGTLALIGTIVATKVNGLALTTAPALIYEGGILFLQTFIALGISCFLLLHYGPRVWQRCKDKQLITQAELFDDHYRSPLIYGLTVFLGITSSFPFVVVQFSAIAKVFSAATGYAVTYEQAILILAFSTGLYVFLGGARAVIWTDVFQGLLLFLLILVTAGLFIHWAGGLGLTTLQTLIPEKLVFNPTNTPVFLDQVLSWSFAFFLWHQVFHRAMMGRSSQVIRQAAWGHFALGFLVKTALLIIGITATAALYGQITDSDRLVAAMYHQHFPLGGILVVVAVFACGMSTIDSILLSLASIFTRDLAEKFLPNTRSETSRYHLAQAISLVILALSTLLALSQQAQGQLAPLVTLGATLATLLLWPLLGMFTWTRATRPGVISAMGLGLCTLIILTLGPSWGWTVYPAGGVSVTTIVFGVSTLSFIGVSLCTQPLLLKPSIPAE